MTDTTIVAVVIIVGVFSLMGLTLHKHGVDSALKLWGGMGALTGVAFGAITSYYFTKQASELEIATLQNKIERSDTLLANYKTTSSWENLSYIPSSFSSTSWETGLYSDWGFRTGVNSNTSWGSWGTNPSLDWAQHTPDYNLHPQIKWGSSAAFTKN